MHEIEEKRDKDKKQTPIFNSTKSKKKLTCS